MAELIQLKNELLKKALASLRRALAEPKTEFKKYLESIAGISNSAGQ